MLRSILSTVILAVAVSGLAQASPQEDMAAAYKAGSYAKVVALAKPLTRLDTPTPPDHRAQVLLGTMYLKGRGVPENAEEAFKLLKSARAFDMGASVLTGWLYFTGQGVEQSYKKAFEMFEVPARSDEDGDAAMMLGWMYRNGLGVSQDAEEAQQWTTIAINKGRTEIPAVPVGGSAADSPVELPSAVAPRMSARLEEVVAEQLESLKKKQQKK
jgi:hypothetical protein